MPRTCRTIVLTVFSSVWSCAGLIPQGATGADFPPRQYSTLQRMEPDRLRATHEDAKRLQAMRKTLPSLDGFSDYRTILHAHAEDSTHTGGTREEMLADAKRAGVHAILLTDHYRPPRDFIDDSWRGMYDGVLFIPGSEANGFLIYPMQSVLARMNDPLPEFIQAVRRDRGLIFLSHIEERPKHDMEGLDGMEIYNRHADAKKDLFGMAGLVLQLTSAESLKQIEEGLRLYPDEMLAAQCSYMDQYLRKWDRETLQRRLTGIAANDCHHNQIVILKMVDENTIKIGTNVDPEEKMQTVPALLRPGIRALTKGRQPGDILARLDFDPYFRSFRNSTTHVLAAELSESAIRLALREGRAYVSHDWMCDPTGFRFELHAEKPTAGCDGRLMGEEISFSPDQWLSADFPVGCRIRLIRNGELVSDTKSDRLDFQVPEPGVYRVEGWLTLAGEDRPWVYSNPIYVRP